MNVPSAPQSVSHTPSPWTAAYDVAADDWTIRGANGEHVTSFSGWEETARADASLIASAPLLLDALTELLALRKVGLHQGGAVTPDHCRVCAAIASAESAIALADPPANTPGGRGDG